MAESKRKGKLGGKLERATLTLKEPDPHPQSDQKYPEKRKHYTNRERGSFEGKGRPFGLSMCAGPSDKRAFGNEKLAVIHAEQ